MKLSVKRPVKDKTSSMGTLRSIKLFANIYTFCILFFTNFPLHICGQKYKLCVIALLIISIFKDDRFCLILVTVAFKTETSFHVNRNCIILN